MNLSRIASARSRPAHRWGASSRIRPDDYAGRLIEAVGLKGATIGGVQISPVHANFIVNTGEGTAADYRKLIDLARADGAREIRR